MSLSKRERVIRTLEHEEADKVPIHYLGYERTGTAYQNYQESEEYRKLKLNPNDDNFNLLRRITQFRFFNADTLSIDPFLKTEVHLRRFTLPDDKSDDNILNSIGERISFRDVKIGDFYFQPTNGRVFKLIEQENTGLPYAFHYEGFFKSEYIVHEVWEKYGKPSDLIREETKYEPQIWDSFVETLSPYLYPMGVTGGNAMFESLFEGMSAGRVAYHMRKKPYLIHEIMAEYTKVNVEIIKRLSEAGVDIIFYYDDLGQKNRSILSIKNFRDFIMPYYKQIYSECKKRGILIIQHSCGYVDKFLPFMVDAGLDGIQALEPAAGVDLASLKDSLGDRVTFMGGMDSSRTLAFGSPSDVEEDVKKCIGAAGHGGGYFAGPSHNILNAPWENVLALRDAIEKYRKYPLKF